MELKYIFTKITNGIKRIEPTETLRFTGYEKKMVAANINFEIVLNAYKENKLNGLLHLLRKDKNGIVRVTKDKKVIQKKVEFMDSTVNE